MARVNSRFAAVTEEEILNMLTFLSVLVMLSRSLLYSNTIILYDLGEQVLLNYSTPSFACHRIFSYSSPPFQRIIVNCSQ